MAPPKREIDEKKVAKYALAGCYTKTIARLMNIPETTLRDRCRDLITQKRAERKYNIRKAQAECVAAKVPSMLIFLGKNDLDQTDRQDINLGGNVSISLEREKITPEDGSGSPKLD